LATAFILSPGGKHTRSRWEGHPPESESSPTSSAGGVASSRSSR
jgi:hypothetical protein